VALAVVGVAPSARAQCGGVDVAKPAHHPRGQRPPLAIGDSSMLLALDELAATGYEANAHGCREFGEALRLLRARRRAGTLPHMVVIALGADGSVTDKDIGQALGLLCCTRLLVLVTPRELGGGSGSDAKTVRAEVRRHRGRTMLLDWVRYSAGHGGWFQPDGLHLTPSGARAFTRLLKLALPYAYPKRKPKRGQRLVFAHPVRAARDAPTDPPPGSRLALATSLSTTGFVSAKVTGPAGAQVQLSELSATPRPLTVVGLGAAGATVSRVLTWLCAPRRRQLLAVTLPPAALQRATATVTTPSCARRLQTAVVRRTRAGTGFPVRVRDRWGLGGLTFTVCIRPPGGPSACRPWRLFPGQARRTIRSQAPRPGGWVITVSMPYGHQSRTLAWVHHPGGRIRLLAAGDSEMQEVDDFLAQDLRPSGVDVTEVARISTGLTNSFFFNWPAHAREQAASLRPDVTVMFLGGNEGFPIDTARGGVVNCCNRAWSAGYAGLVAPVMRTYLRADAGRVYWFLLPTPRTRHFQSLFDAVNAGIRQAAGRFAGRASLIDANGFFTPHDRYRDFMSYRGRGLVIHESDGVHLSTTANEIAASLVVHRLRADRIIPQAAG
jgi:lysophospholipase L1-like esterase